MVRSHKGFLFCLTLWMGEKTLNRKKGYYSSFFFFSSSFFLSRFSFFIPIYINIYIYREEKKFNRYVTIRWIINMEFMERTTEEIIVR